MEGCFEEEPREEDRIEKVLGEMGDGEDRRAAEGESGDDESDRIGDA
jgi:hypothetical protein